MASTPIASVIMAVYNGSEFIDRAITSVLNQTESNFELIIVNDGSTDNTKEIVERFTDERIKFYETKTNNGISQARNIGLAHCTGDYIFILDSDDEMLPDRIEEQSNFLIKNKNIHVCGSHVEKVIDGKNVLMRYPNDDSIIKSRLLSINGSALIDPSTCMRKAFIANNYINYPGAMTDMDHELWWNCTKSGAHFGICEKLLIRYHRHGKNITSENSPEFKSHINNKSNLRRQIILGYFPNLTAKEANAVANLMNPLFKHNKNSIQEAIKSIWKCYQEDNTYYGENKNACHGILSKYEAAALNTLKN